MKIAVTGIGGVGGFFGGLLAKYYDGSSTEIFFIARGENAQVIQERGLQMQTMNGNFTVHPKKVTSDPSQIGTVDILLCCTKGYDLEDAIVQCLPCINNKTILLPLLNGVDAKERIAKIYPENEIWDGCVYLVSRLEKPGVVKETGNIRKLFFGSENGQPERLEAIEKIFLDAGIDATWSENIEETIWEKFLFISPIATLTSYLDKTIAKIFSDGESEKLLQQLLGEIKGVADAKGILLPENTTRNNIDKMRSLPAGTTSSMHSDFIKGGRTELESLTGHVVRLAESLGVSTPVYIKMFEKLRSVRWQEWSR